MRGLLSAMLLFFGFLSANAQSGLSAHYSFDGCDAFDETGNADPGVIGGNPGCGCGVEGNALYFDGQDDYIDFSSGYGPLLSSDFSVSFYFLPANLNGIVDVFSKRVVCAPDSAVALRYEPVTRTLTGELTEGINERAIVTATLPERQCWFHITWVRQERDLIFYIDGEEVSRERYGGQVNANNPGTFSLSNGPCLANGELRLQGAMDELKLFNRALNEDEVRSLYTPIDFLATPDTIVFVGENAQMRLPRSCAISYNWVPSTGVSDVSSPEPLITPLETETYSVEMNYGFCQAVDTVRIIVVDSSELDCNDVHLPTAFTPNGDGLNDEFGLSNGNYFLGDFISMEIYDRWGSRLFEGLTAMDQWDGTVNGENMMPGMYVYKVRYLCDGQEEIKAGSFNLFR